MFKREPKRTSPNRIRLSISLTPYAKDHRATRHAGDKKGETDKCCRPYLGRNLIIGPNFVMTL